MDERVSKPNRKASQDKDRKRYPPARAQKLYDRPETPQQRDRRVAAIVKKARRAA